VDLKLTEDGNDGLTCGSVAAYLQKAADGFGAAVTLAICKVVKDFGSNGARRVELNNKAKRIEISHTSSNLQLLILLKHVWQYLST
jgi:hypothetical protein